MVEEDHRAMGVRETQLATTQEMKTSRCLEKQRHRRNHQKQSVGNTLRRTLPWCPHCVRSCGRGKAHWRVAHEEAGEAFVSFDYAAISERDGSQLGVNDRSRISVLVGTERTTSAVFCTAVPSKGADPHTVDSVTRYLSSLGTHKVRIMSDQETSLMELLKLRVADQVVARRLHGERASEPRGLTSVQWCSRSRNSRRCRSCAVILLPDARQL